ncbi:MAG TPA: glutathione S-transferase N-terminal domain-containing protein [Myxococcales bacterium]|jgi:glutathione S-transferase|nr:glutathione S-transferase N-terminal domain-containing protein [Myxococcales bacterium]
MDAITLYADTGFCSPWVLSVWTTLKEKGIPFAVHTLDLPKGEAKTPQYRKDTVTGKVPALRVGNEFLAESLAIVEYLEFAFPDTPRMLAKEPLERARDLQLMSWLRTDLFELRRCMPFEGIFKPDVVPPPMTAQAHDEADLLIRVTSRRTVPSHAKNPTLADFELGFAVRRLLRFDKRDLANHALAAAFSEVIWQRPSVQSWVRQERT